MSDKRAREAERRFNEAQRAMIAEHGARRRLIAAVPHMLTALRRIADSSVIHDGLACRDIARAALAAAEGE